MNEPIKIPFYTIFCCQFYTHHLIEPMKKVTIFETHYHLYYWPNFWPIVEELKKRCNYEIQVSIPKRDSRSEEIQLMDICKKMKIQFIQSENVIYSKGV